MSRAGALAQAVAILLESEQQESIARVDLCISLRVADVDTSGEFPRYVKETAETLIEVGGVWNKRAKRWEPGHSETLNVIWIPRGSEQEPAARWIAEWLKRIVLGPKGKHWEDFDRAWTLLLEGGRRAGKSFLSCAALVAYAVAIPNALVWGVSPTNDETAELEDAIRAMLPPAWFTFRGGGGNRASQFRFPNGSRILLISGHKPRTLKRGRVDLVLYNEGQNMARAGWVQLRGAIADTGGLVIISANPPDTEIGRWIEDLHERIRAKKIHAVLFKLTMATNPFVEQQSLEDMAEENDELTYRREVLGEFVPIGDVVMHAWSDSGNVLDPPDHLVDVTAEVTKKDLGRAFGYVIGADFQMTPHMAAVVRKFFRDPKSPTPDEVIPWVVDEFVVEDADENDLLDAIERAPRWRAGGREESDCYRGWPEDADDKAHPVHCAVVMDASGWWQDGAHTKGRTSDKAFKARRWVWLYKPQKDSDKNPDVIERCKTTNRLCKSAAGTRRMFVARHCIHVIRAMRSWENKNGFPNRKSRFAHVCDAVSYVDYRFYGRPKVKRTLEYKSAGKHSRTADLDGGGGRGAFASSIDAAFLKPRKS